MLVNCRLCKGTGFWPDRGLGHPKETCMDCKGRKQFEAKEPKPLYPMNTLGLPKWKGNKNEIKTGGKKTLQD